MSPIRQKKATFICIFYRAFARFLCGCCPRLFHRWKRHSGKSGNNNTINVSRVDPLSISTSTWLLMWCLRKRIKLPLRNLMRCFLDEQGRIATIQNCSFISISHTWHLCFTICCYCSIIIISEEDQRDNGPKHHHHLLIADFFITLSRVSINKVPNCHVHLFIQRKRGDHFELFFKGISRSSCTNQ